MCGRFAMDEKVDEQIVNWIDAGNDRSDWKPTDWVDPSQLEPRYSVAPRTLVPILRRWQDTKRGPQQGAYWAQWGFHPTWADVKAPSPINARLETAPHKGYFRTAFASYRCVIVMSGYFEWVAQEDGKQPYFLHTGAPLYAAGLMAGMGEERNFTILTHPGYDNAGTVHDRMPVFLTADALEEWTDPSPLARRGGADALAALIAASGQSIAKMVDVYPVSRAINNVRTADPRDERLVTPLES